VLNLNGTLKVYLGGFTMFLRVIKIVWRFFLIVMESFGIIFPNEMVKTKKEKARGEEHRY